jgi:hypothetical protein
MFLNGVEITDEQLAKENSYDEYANDPEHTLSEKANKLAKEGEKVPGLSTSETIRNNWLVGRTLSLFKASSGCNPIRAKLASAPYLKFFKKASIKVNSPLLYEFYN